MKARPLGGFFQDAESLGRGRNRYRYSKVPKPYPIKRAPILSTKPSHSDCDWEPGNSSECVFTKLAHELLCQTSCEFEVSGFRIQAQFV